MKLGRVTNNDKVERLAISTHESVVKQLKAYQDFYKSQTNDEIGMSQLVEEMAKRFMTEDKAFQKFLAAHKTA